MKFIVQASWGGENWFVLCITGYGISIEIPEMFLSQDEARQWISTKSKGWMEARARP
jgi:hypothetical protein